VEAHRRGGLAVTYTIRASDLDDLSLPRQANTARLGATFRPGPLIQFLIQINFPLAGRARPLLQCSNLLIFIVHCII